MSSIDLISITALVRKVQADLPEIVAKMINDSHVEFVAPKEKIRNIVTLLTESVQMLFPESVIGIDLEDDKYEVIYMFWSHLNNFLCQVRVSLDGPEPSIETVSDIIAGLEWHERETHEMFGINFEGNPDLSLLLLPEELEGQYPLRKIFKTDRSREDESGLSQPKPRPKEGGASE
ncbi:MAG: NADH-quinone oxidoreductase subunit C [Candidatus Thorarchaeota archaeon]|nr:NADH-quinone oxidoreductase subunit C [Candidatus Thorarchaeota archaeon]